VNEYGKPDEAIARVDELIASELEK